MDINIYVLSFIMLTVGAVVKTLYDFGFKIVEDPNLAFDRKYIVTMLLAIFGTIALSPLLFLNVTIPQGSEAFIAISMYCIGFTGNHMLNRPVSLAARIIEKARSDEPAESKS